MSKMWKRARGVDRGTRIFAAYLTIVLVVAMAAPGLAAQPSKHGKNGKSGSAAEEPVLVAPASEPAAPDAPAPEVAEPAAPSPDAPAPDAPAPSPEPASEPVPAEVPAVPAVEGPTPTVAAASVVEPVVALSSAIGPSASVTPVFVPGNPALGDGGIKIQPPVSGTYRYDDAAEVNEPGVPDDFELVVTVDADGKTFSFTCNYLITQVIVKGGPDAYAYNYPGGTYGDSDLVSPTMANGQVPGLSHMNFYFKEIEDPEEGSLKVYKYLDENENGEYDEGEEMLEDWDFTLTRESAPIGPVSVVASAIELVGLGSTDINGELLFGELAVGEYAVTETLQDGWHCTTGLKRFAEVKDGETAELWFGNHPDPEVPETGDLLIHKYLDENENDQYDEGELMLGNWEFTVTIETPPLVGGVTDAAVALVGTGVTDFDGELPFGGLDPDEYTVRETLQDGWHTTGQLTRTATVAVGETAHVWFGNHPDPQDPETGALIIHKYNDENENGEYDTGEAMLPGWEFTVVNPAGPVVPNAVDASVALIGSGQTGTDGTLGFGDLNPGTVIITETMQDGWKSTTGISEEAQIVAGQTTHVWFGNAEDFLRFTELDLAITKVADDHTVDEGQLVTYTLTWWNLMTEEDAIDYTIVDDYDERYLTIVNANGGTVAGGKITWTFAGPLSAAMGKQTLSYTARVIADMPDAVTNIDNVVVIDDDRDFNPTNNRDDERVVYRPTTPDDPFLPFTGGEYLMLLIAAATAASVGLVLRVQSRQDA